MKKHVTTLAWACLGAAAMLVGAAGSADAQDTRVRWKMQSAFASSLTHLGPSGVRFSKDIERMSAGKFEVKFYEPGALIPPLECFDAVSKGSIESCWTTPGYHTGKYPSLAFFTTVPLNSIVVSRTTSLCARSTSYQRSSSGRSPVERGGRWVTKPRSLE